MAVRLDDCCRSFPTELFCSILDQAHQDPQADKRIPAVLVFPPLLWTVQVLTMKEGLGLRCIFA